MTLPLLPLSPSTSLLPSSLDLELRAAACPDSLFPSVPSLPPPPRTRSEASPSSVERGKPGPCFSLSRVTRMSSRLPSDRDIRLLPAGSIMRGASASVVAAAIAGFDARLKHRPGCSLSRSDNTRASCMGSEGRERRRADSRLESIGKRRDILHFCTQRPTGARAGEDQILLQLCSAPKSAVDVREGISVRKGKAGMRGIFI